MGLSLADYVALDAVAIATAVRAGHLRAREVADAALHAVDTLDPTLNSHTTVVAERTGADAEAVDAAIAAGEPVGPLAGVPYGVKDLFDISGVTTVAGSSIHSERPPASADSAVGHRVADAGGLLTGALNMDEYAYGFTTENSHYGPAHNPHDPTRIAGGSSGGTAAAVAGGLVPMAIGTDTNGSIRVPTALCGVFGLKPTYGVVSRAGSVVFAPSFDHVGIAARSVRDLAATLDVVAGFDPTDPGSTEQILPPTTPSLGQSIDGLRIAVADGWFAEGGVPEVFAAVARVAQALDAERTITIPAAARGRAAAYVITAAEGANQHLDDLRSRPEQFDPMTRDRFLAGALLPASLYVRAQRFRRWYRDQVLSALADVDVFLAPTVPFPATTIGQRTIELDEREVVVAPNLGVFTQPLSCIGLPVVSVPIHGIASLPLGVQLVAKPFDEALLLRVAAALEADGIASAPVPSFG